MSSQAGVRHGPIVMNTRWQRQKSGVGVGATSKGQPNRHMMSAIVPIGTVTVGMPKWRIARLPFATQTPLRHAMSAEAGFVSASAGPTSATAGKTTASRSIACPSSPLSRGAAFPQARASRLASVGMSKKLSRGVRAGVGGVVGDVIFKASIAVR